jgi:hypothetical protein
MSLVFPQPPETPIVSKWMTVRALMDELKKYEKTRNIMVAVPAKGLHGDMETGEVQTFDMVGYYPVVGLSAQELDDGRKVLVFVSTEDAPHRNGNRRYDALPELLGDYIRKRP